MRRLIRSAVLLLSVLSAHASTHRSGVVGIASWYGPQHHGRKTASGQRFNEHDLTAASPTLPFGTRVHVTFLKTGKSVDVRITDRGPWRRHRILDLSEAAANVIGLKPFGVGRVTVEVLN
jgi:rare lipoprotein A